MDSNQITDTAMGLEVIYKATMELYQSYFEALEAAIDNTADDDLERLTELHALAQEGQESLEYDLGIFDKVISLDAEGLANMDDELKIQALHKKLKND